MIKERSDQIPLYRKGVGGIGNTSNVVHHRYIKGKKSPPEGGKALTNIGIGKLLTHITLDIVVVRTVAVERSLIQSLLCRGVSN